MFHSSRRIKFIRIFCIDEQQQATTTRVHSSIGKSEVATHRSSWVRVEGGGRQTSSLIYSWKHEESADTLSKFPLPTCTRFDHVGLRYFAVVGTEHRNHLYLCLLRRDVTSFPEGRRTE